VHVFDRDTCCKMSSISSPASGSLQIKWDPKNLEIRTKSVEKTLEPLVTQVCFIAVTAFILVLVMLINKVLLTVFLSSFYE